MSINTKSAHLIDVRFKILYLFIFSILAFIIPEILPCSRFFVLFGMIFISFVISVIFYFHSKYVMAKSISNYFMRVLKTSMPVYVLCSFTLVFNAFRITDAGLITSVVGIGNGIYFALRIAYLVWISLSVIYTTSSRELVLALRSILSPLKVFKINVNDLTLTINIALRFIPEMMAEYRSIVESQWCRGAKTDSGNIFVSINSHISSVLPLMIRMMSKVDDYALALLARGWRGK